ncbi:hypothetical protein EUGRSUZ_D02388 [Eucalyptus grandis]|uniref:Uncharacterized protein n=2 Tax=Eucalyptus grandis TaxID=71139 RepID=A0ACC3L8P8_EUCGR|nr:hypothetical protein EUGRSUZ_D02388 [Eucalyptus grandis]
MRRVGVLTSQEPFAEVGVPVILALVIGSTEEPTGNETPAVAKKGVQSDLVFVRDFVPSGLACLMKKEMEPEIVKNFLLRTLHPKAGKRESITSLLEKESCLRASKSVLTCKTKRRD